MSLLSIIQDATKRLGFTPQNTVISSTDPVTVQLLALANEEGFTLSRRHEWQVLQTEHTFSTADGTASYALPSDFSRIMKETVFNRTSGRRMLGDLTPAQWQETQASLVTMVNPAFRIRGNLFLISPTPSAVETIAYEYISTKWCESSGGTDQTTWAADTDVGRLDEGIMTLGIIWRYRRAKGLGYGEDMNTYEMEVNKAILNDGARVRIDTGGYERDRIPNAPVAPETIVF